MPSVNPGRPIIGLNHSITEREGKLLLPIKKEIEHKKDNIQKLNSAIKDLTNICDKFSKLLQTSQESTDHTEAQKL